MTERGQKIPGWGWAGMALGLLVIVVLAPGWVGTLRATHGAVASYVDLLAAANRGDLAGVRRLCTTRYLAGHSIAEAKEGGVVGLPRNIHKNFQAWRDDGDVLLCPTNRVGPVYRFVREEGVWKFDGPAGLLGPGGRMIRGGEEGSP